MLFPAVLFVSIALVQQITPAQPTRPPAPPAVAETTVAPTVEVETADRSPTTQVCRTEPVTGSRFGRRVCRSSSETSDDRRDSQEMLRRMQGARMPDGG